MIRGKNKSVWMASGMLGLSLLAGSAQATLITVTTGTAAGNAVYDDVSNLTWIKNANLAASNTFGVAGINADGTMTWDTAQSWITAMNASDGGNGYLGFNDWRLPVTPQPDASCSTQLNPGGSFPSQGFGLNCTGSELGDLYHNALSVTSGSSILTSTLLQGADPIFTNVQSGLYWSGTEFAPFPTSAWFFGVNNGSQLYDGKIFFNNRYGWAVRTGNAGDVGQVPLPGTLLLLGLGALGLRLARRRVC